MPLDDSSSSSKLNETVSAPSAATLTNRHSKISQDSSLIDSAAPAADLVEPSAPLLNDSADVSGQQKADATHIWAVSKPAGIPHESGLPLAADQSQSKNLDSNVDDGSNVKFNLHVPQKELGEERDAEQWANEPRSGRLTEVQ